MEMKTVKMMACCLLMGFGGQAQAKVSLPEILSDHMVLQQQTEVNLWGWAGKDAEVRVTPSWKDTTYVAQADGEGKWTVRVQTPAASYTPHTLRFADADSELTLRNVLIGEVWFCSGQSNMEMPLNGFWNCPVENANETIATAGEWPGIRMAVIQKIGTLTPQERAHGTWKECTPENAQWFSATAYSFAQMVNRVLGIPVGVISCAWGGSRVEGWLPEDLVKAYSDVDLAKERIVPEEGKDWHYHTPTIMYNGMLHPLRHYTIRGFLWYQGESNVGKETTYVERLTTMINLWRKLWGQGELPFCLVELAPYDYGENISGALLREAQYRVATTVPNCGLVSTNDLVYPFERPQIHPCQKREVGNRLAYWALNKIYGRTAIACESPVFREMTVEGHAARLSFFHADEGFSPWHDIEGFEVAGEDRVFHPAQARLDDKMTILVESEAVPTPVAVRYCFRNFQSGNLKNHRGLPVIPFRTDNW